MKGVPYYAFAVVFRRFLEDHDFASPSSFWRDLKIHMDDKAPSESSVWAAFYGHRLLPVEALLFMQERYKFRVRWREASPVKIDGAERKQNQLSLPGMRELKR
jgi:hypothetical protein